MVYGMVWYGPWLGIVSLDLHRRAEGLQGWARIQVGGVERNGEEWRRGVKTAKPYLLYLAMYWHLLCTPSSLPPYSWVEELCKVPMIDPNPKL